MTKFWLCFSSFWIFNIRTHIFMPPKGKISSDLGVSLAPWVNTRQIRVHMQMLCKWRFSYTWQHVQIWVNYLLASTWEAMPRARICNKSQAGPLQQNALRALPTVEIACCHFNCLIKLLPNLLTRPVQYVFRELSRRTKRKKLFARVCVRAYMR